MALVEAEDRARNYVNFKASIGLLTQKSDENDPIAKPRTYVDSRTQEEKTVYERRYKSLSGKLVGVEVDEESEYGAQILLTIRDDKDYTFCVPIKAPWGQKIAEALPNVDREQDVQFVAFGDFTTDDGKEVRAGVSLKQDGEKVKSFFTRWNNDTKQYEQLHGFPESPKEEDYPPRTATTKRKKFWDDHFFKVGDFLLNYIKENHTLVPEAQAKDEDEF